MNCTNRTGIGGRKAAPSGRCQSAGGRPGKSAWARALSRAWSQAVPLAAAGVLLAACGDKEKSDPLAPAVGPRFASSGSTNVNLDQWANGSGSTAAAWQNGNLNGNNSQYGEGKVVPFRLALEGLGAGQHFITLQYDFTANGAKAYDFLASADATESTIFSKICSTGGGGVSSLCNGSTGAMPGSVPFVDVDLPGDPFVGAQVGGNDLTVDGAIAQSSVGGSRKFRVYGISDPTKVLLSNTSHGTATLTGGTITGNTVGQFLVTFTPDVAGPVLMVWGGHLAESGYWDGPTPRGASTISGAPWHMRTQNLDNGGASNQDRSIQPSAIVPPVLELTKAANPAGPVDAGTDIGFDITVKNKGPGSAYSLTVTDALPGATGISWSTSTVGCQVTGTAPTQTLNCSVTSLAENATFVARVTSATTGACGVITNPAAIAKAANSAQVTSGPASVTVRCASVSINKSAVTGTVSAGENISFDVTVSNGGDGQATNVGVNDPLPNAGGSWSIVSQTNNGTACSVTGTAPSQTLACSGITLAAAGSAGDSYTVRVTSGTTVDKCGTISNTANLVSPLSGSSTAQVVVNCPDVKIAKTVVNGSVNSGDPVQFDIVVSNAGLGKAYSVGFSDVLPSFGGTWSIVSQSANACSIGGNPLSLTCSAIELAPTTGSYTVRVQSTTDGSVCTKVTNTAKLSSPYSGSSSDDATVNCPNVGIAKTAVSATVNAGDNVQFDIVASNTGLGKASGVGFTDVLPSFGGTWSIVSQSANACSIGGTPLALTCSGIELAASTGSYTVRIQSTTDGSVCKKVSNTANLSSPYSGTSSADVTVNCPNVSIKKTATNQTITVGDPMLFAVVVSNTGAAPATGVGFTDTPPNVGGTWSIASQSGGACSIAGTPAKLTCAGITLAATTGTYTVSLTSTTTTGAACGKITNTANLSSPFSGSSSADVTVDCPLAKLTVQKQVVGGTSTQLFDFTQTTPTNASYTLQHGGSKETLSLQPGKYTVCEANLAVSWHATATVDGAPATLVNPNASDVPSQDLGTRCLDVTLNYKDAKTVVWTNTPPPGGDARTIGYWKNWASCSASGGNQWAKALQRAIWNKTLDGNLPQTIGLLELAGAPEQNKPAAGCANAVNILNKSTLSGQKMASDPAYNLAAQLLAAKLSVKAGAKECAAEMEAASKGQALLVVAKFNGTGSYAKAVNATTANGYAATLDKYNNNQLCQ